MSVLGLETEYGVFVAGADAQPDPISLSEAVIRCVDAPGTTFDFADEHPLADARGTVLPRRIAHPDLLTDEVRHVNQMLANGGRSYVDHAHPEWSGPEVATAREALVWDRAGDRLHREAAQRASERHGLNIHLVKNTTDNKGRSYGCHENYLLPRDLPFDVVVQQLPGFLASRVVVTGAGRVGLGQRGETPRFQTSQRADFFERLVGLETTVNRPLVNTRDEAHADQAVHRRLHVITGDANLCQVANLVKVGSAQLALRAIVAGARLPQPVDPLAAMRAWSRDPSCTRTQPCDDGVERTAVDLQRLWWQAASEQEGQPDAIADAPEVLRHWDGVLTDLATDPMRCADRVDWVAKLRLLEGLRSRYGCGWADPRLTALDLRLADHASGLFDRLEATGAVQTLVADGEVSSATRTPPGSTRAWVRGTLLGRFSSHVMAANWDRLTFDTAGGHRTLQLVSPLDGTRAAWESGLHGVHEMDQLLTWGESIGWSTQSTVG